MNDNNIQEKIKEFNAFFPDWGEWRKLRGDIQPTELIDELKKARAEMSYGGEKAQDLAVNNKKCLICVEANMETLETLTCRKCEKILLDGYRAENKPNSFFPAEARKRQKEIKESHGNQ